ncbi:MAG: nitrous oxide reductase family maturation protein NosD [Methylobacteriaceae bacterium]|nr:nitrous oxide reductase family maturation protein NosD [Methylobacteriaceae bacterium]
MARALATLWAKRLTTGLAALAVTVVVGVAVTKVASRFGVYDLTRNASFTDHSLPPPDPRSEDELESLRRFPPGATRLQPLIDATPTGGVLTLRPGVYAAPGRVDRQMRIEAEKGAVVDGGGVGSIVTVTADDVAISGLTLRNSGERHETTDAAIRLRGKHGSFKDNVIENCLFGFELKQADRNIIRRNRIQSKRLPEALRGDAIRVWYSTGNIIEDNDIERTRDLVVWYAGQNRIAGNRIRESRYGAHLMYAHGNSIEKNHFMSNTVGVFLMYANDTKIVGNVITYSQGPSGIGVGFKESSNTLVVNNDIFANARGVFMDASPYDPEGFNRFEMNRIAYNGVAVAFHSDWEGNAFAHNAFIGNHRAVTVAGARSAKRNRWDGNYWDDYEGFDRNRDGVGDTPYESWSWADRLWMDVPDAQFFRAAPSLEAIDFVERLGAFHEPQLIIRDSAPLFAPPAGAGAPRADKGS